MALQNLKVKFDADTSGLQQGFKEAQSGLSGFRSGIASAVKTGLSIVGITAGLAAVVAGLKKAETAFVGLESSMMRTNDIFGDSAKNIRSFAENTAKSYGMAETSAYQYAAVYGNLFRGITSGAEENSRVTIAMLKASAVIASKTGRTMDDVMERIRSGLLGNTEAIEDLGINVGVAAIEATAAFKKIADGRSWDQLSFQEQQQVRTLAILEQTQQNYGDTVQKSGAYSLSVLSGAFKDLTAAAGVFVNAGLQPVIEGLTRLVEGATAALKALAALMGVKVKVGQSDAAGGKALQTQAKAQNDVAEAAEKTVKVKQRLAGFDKINTLPSPEASAGTGGAASDSSPLSGVGAAENVEISEPDTSWVSGVQKKFQSLADFFSTKFAPSISAWGKAFSSLQQPAANAFASIRDSATSLWQNTLAPFGGYLVGKWIPDIANGFSQTFAPIFSDVMAVALSEFALDFQFTCQQIDNIVHDVFWPAMDFMRGAALDVFGGIQASWAEHGSGILKGFQDFKESLRQIWTSLYDNIFKPVFESIGGTVQWLWDKHLKPLWDNMADFIGSLTEFLFALWNNVLAPFVQWFIQYMGPPIVLALRLIGDVFGSVFGAIADVVGGVFKILGGLLDFLTGVFTGDWDKAWKGVRKIFQGVWNTFYGIVKLPINLIIDALNFLIRGLNLFKIHLPDWLKYVPLVGQFAGQTIGFNIAEIPKLASGGLVEQPAVVQVGEYAGAQANPEVIAPLDRLKDLLRAGPGGDINLTVYTTLEDGSLVSKTVKRISRGAANAGKPILGVS